MLSTIFIFDHLTFNPALQKNKKATGCEFRFKKAQRCKKKLENQIKKFVKINYFNSQ